MSVAQERAKQPVVRRHANRSRAGREFAALARAARSWQSVAAAARLRVEVGVAAPGRRFVCVGGRWGGGAGRSKRQRAACSAYLKGGTGIGARAAQRAKGLEGWRA